MFLRVFTDGGARGNPGPAAAAFIIAGGEEILAKEGFYLGKATNNVAEYQAVLRALNWLLAHREKIRETEKIAFFLDSKLVVSQLNGQFKIKARNLLPLVLAIKQKEKSLGVPVSYSYIPRFENKAADLLVNQTLDKNA
ncbi:ribonuclease HI family protein [Candidatus Shapirobacteria bacterium]|nr:ribonuclease HI family protein [Candidatus Shapirobacteria bacterium]